MGPSLAKTLLFLPTIAYFFKFYPNARKDSSAPPAVRQELKKEAYDFVIVGGGTAGSILANRLSEDASTSVLLLEAGGQESHEAQIPAVAYYLQLTDLDWQYKTAPSSTSCLAMEDNRCNLPRGKVLGGSSSINLMLYVRGNKKDFNLWEDLGNQGWGFNQVLSYFKKSEDNTDFDFAQNTEYHGVGGYQKISKLKWRTQLAEAYLEAGRELGYKTLDINAESQVGFMIPQGFHHNGARFSNSKAFLKPIRERSNLDIILHTRVTKILFNDYKRAHTVLFEHENQNKSVGILKEVILSAGAFGSPHLLMLSGIGPDLQLRKVGIKPLVNLPVGRNLQDHVAGCLPFVVDKPVSLRMSRVNSMASVYQYAVRGSGPLTTLGGVEALGFVNTRYSNMSLEWPDVQFQFVSGTFASDNGQYLRHAINLRQETWDKYLQPLADLDAFSIMVKLMRPRSRGFMELESSDPSQMPKIITNYLTEPYDVVILTEGLKIAKAIGETKALKRFGSKLYNKPVPGCENIRIRSDRYWECFLRHLTFTIYHYSGTTKMGPYWDPEAVVDPQLRVYGTAGLRVVDASIFPLITTGNTNAAVMMVAEKASDMIKASWQDARKLPPAINIMNEKEKEVSDESSGVSVFRLPVRSKRDVSGLGEMRPRIVNFKQLNPGIGIPINHLLGNSKWRYKNENEKNQKNPSLLLPNGNKIILDSNHSVSTDKDVLPDRTQLYDFQELTPTKIPTRPSYTNQILAPFQDSTNQAQATVKMVYPYPNSTSYARSKGTDEDLPNSKQIKSVKLDNNVPSIIKVKSLGKSKTKKSTESTKKLTEIWKEIPKLEEYESKNINVELMKRKEKSKEPNLNFIFVPRILTSGKPSKGKEDHKAEGSLQWDIEHQDL